MASSDLLDPWMRYLRRRDSTLSQREEGVLRDAVAGQHGVAADTDLVREHDRPAHSTLLLQGWACRYISLDDGRRQILAFHVPGEFVDLHSFPLRRMDHAVGALTTCRVATVPHDTLRRITEDEPHLTRLLWLSTIIDAAILRQWLLGAGKRSALEHAAHLICELHVRLEVAGLTDGAVFDLPFTQTEFGDALGISQVHANRTLQELKATGLLSWRGTRVEILDGDRLCALAQFDRAYLQLEDEPR